MTLAEIRAIWRNVAQSRGIAPQRVDEVANHIDNALVRRLPAGGADISKRSLQVSLERYLEGDANLAIARLDQGYMLASCIAKACLQDRPSNGVLKEIGIQHQTLIETVVSGLVARQHRQLPDDLRKRLAPMLDAHWVAMRTRLTEAQKTHAEDVLFPALKRPLRPEELARVVDQWASKVDVVRYDAPRPLMVTPDEQFKKELAWQANASVAYYLYCTLLVENRDLLSENPFFGQCLWQGSVPEPGFWPFVLRLQPESSTKDRHNDSKNTD